MTSMRCSCHCHEEFDEVIICADCNCKDSRDFENKRKLKEIRTVMEDLHFNSNDVCEKIKEILELQKLVEKK